MVRKEFLSIRSDEPVIIAGAFQFSIFFPG